MVACALSTRKASWAYPEPYSFCVDNRHLQLFQSKLKIVRAFCIKAEDKVLTEATRRCPPHTGDETMTDETTTKVRASNRIKRVNPDSYYRALEEMGNATGDDNFCAVIALALVTDMPFPEAQAVMEELGRKKGQGMNNSAIRKAMKDNGAKLRKVKPESFIAKYPKPHCHALKNVTTHHPRRFHDVFAQGTYVLFTSDHVAVCVDGELKDWAVNNALRVKHIYKVTN